MQGMGSESASAWCLALGSILPSSCTAECFVICKSLTSTVDLFVSLYQTLAIEYDVVETVQCNFKQCMCVLYYCKISCVVHNYLSQRRAAYYLRELICLPFSKKRHMRPEIHEKVSLQHRLGCSCCLSLTACRDQVSTAAMTHLTS